VPQTRFQIEEILSQDVHGALFLAIDGESGDEVLLQRFFPFGVGERGLDAEERVSYDHAIEQMKHLSHPKLRSVIDGGSDPVDGIPFMVTESRRGMSLQRYVSQRFLSETEAVTMADHALELMEWFEQQFGRDVDWLSLHPADVEVLEEGCLFRFRIDPMKWLGLRQGPSLLGDLANLLESSRGWTEQMVAASEMGPLADWLRAVKSREWSARDALRLLRGEEIPVSSPTASAAIPKMALVKYASHPSPAMAARPNQAKSSMLRYGWLSLVLVLLSVGRGIWWYKTKKTSEDRVVHSAPSKKKGKEQPSPEAEVLKSKEANLEGDYVPQESREIRKRMGQEISLMEKVSAVSLSSSGKSLYIEFSGGGQADSRVRGRYLTELGMKGMSLKELAHLKGKKVRIRGKVTEERPTGRLIIDLTSSSQISVVEGR
jgi:hypothetical protein